MNKASSARGQRGVITIFICIVLLVLITLMVTTAFSLSTMNLTAVGNAQTRDEAIAAANFVIERELGTPFYVTPVAQIGLPVNINNDPVKIDDYLVDLAIPVCIRSTVANVNAASSVTLPGMTASGAWNTVWELDAIATEITTGTSVRVRHGVRVLLSNTQKTLLCP